MILGIGGIGVGVLFTAFLYIMLVRGRRWAWVALLALDVVFFGILVAATDGLRTVPLLLPIVQGLALVTLFWPSIARHVGAARPVS